MKMKEKMYLVTGAAGFLGGTICRELIARGDRVRALSLIHISEPTRRS